MVSLRLLLRVSVPSVYKRLEMVLHAPCTMVVQFAKKQHKVAVFKARGKVAGTKVGLDDDLTHLQQQRKNAGLTSRTSGPRVPRHSGMQRSYL